MPESCASSARKGASSGAPAAARVRVLLPLPLEGPYDYRLPHGEAMEPGDFVVVPLGRRELAGCVWDEGRDATGCRRVRCPR
jgi:primosomal protein N' (replication factor Y)